MPSLRELQRRFADDILARGDTTRTTVRASGSQDGERMAIYRRTIGSNYRNAMGATYPAVRRIVGTAFFHEAVEAYSAAHPSRSGDLNEFGDAFGDFLERYPQAANLEYLPDVARLEWAIDESNRAANSLAALEAVIAALSQAAADELPELRLRIEPSCRLRSSPFPLLRIWQVNQPDYGGDLPVDLAAGPDHLRIRREQACSEPDAADPGIVIERVDAGHFHWLSALAEGATLATAIERALSVDAGFDLQTAFHRFIGDGTVAGMARRTVEPSDERNGQLG